MSDVSKANRESKTSDLNLELNAITRFRLDEINKIKEYFNSEIKERNDIIKKSSKYIVTLDYADKIFVTLSASFGTLTLVSHATIVGIPVGIAGSSLTLIFTITTGIIKKLLNITRKKRKRNMIKMSLARNKLNIIKTLLSSTLNELEISQEEFARIIDEKIKYEGIKENIKNICFKDLNEESNKKTNL